MAKIKAMTVGATLALMTMGLCATSTLAQPVPASALTLNKPNGPPGTPVQSWQPGQPVPWVRSIPVDMAITAAKAALAACRGKHASIGVVDHDGRMIVMYVDDYATMLGQKALPGVLHTAVIRQTATQEMSSHSAPGVAPETDWEAKIIDRFNEGSLIAPGAIPLFVGTQPNRSFIGAIGVAGVEPPGKGATADNQDHACAMAGSNAIKDYLKWAQNAFENKRMTLTTRLVTAVCTAGLLASAVATPSLAAAKKAVPAPAAAKPQINWVKSIPLDLAIAAVEVAIADCRKAGKRGSFGVMDMDGNWKVHIIDDNTGEVGQHALEHKMYTSVLTQQTTYPMIVEAEEKYKTRGEIAPIADLLDKIAPGGLVSPGGYALKIDGQFVGVLGAGGTAQGYGPGSEAKCAEAGGKWFEEQVKNSK